MKESADKVSLVSGRSPKIGASELGYSKNRKNKKINAEDFEKLLDEIQQNIDRGLSSTGEKIIKDSINKLALDISQKGLLDRFLSYAIEMKGNYEAALSILKIYENEKVLAKTDKKTEISVLTQLAISYSNIGDFPKAIALLNSAHANFPNHQADNQLGLIYIAFSRVYRRLTEFPIARDYAEKALKTFRDTGNWRGMSEANSLLGAFCQQEGDLENAVEYLQQSIKMVGDRQAPFILGRAYSELSGAV